MPMLRTAMGWLLGKRLPVTTGELNVPSLRAAVTIRRDATGIPHIEAASDHDAWFALGFCQAQDRAFQLESTLRVCRGTLSEMVGSEGVPIDRMSRRIGFHRSAVLQLSVLADDVRELIDAFVGGVNAGQKLGLPNKPHELAILGGELTPWTGADVIAFLKFTSFLLPSNWDAELARLKIVTADGPDALAALDPAGINSPGQTFNGSPAVIAALQTDLAAFQSFAKPGGGSNNWVIAGSRTASGKPLLASDPHLGPTLPSPWYLAHVRTPAWAVAGATFAGCPTVVIGHNEEAAWGVTAGLQDNADLFLETLTGNETKLRETIVVKGGADVIEDVIVTPRGPIISPLLPGLTQAISLQAVWLKALPVRGFLFAQLETTFEEFRKPFAEWPLLPLNLVYVDKSGTIAYQLCGQTPTRKVGYGLMPRPAVGDDTNWGDLIPFDAMPRLVNPSAGYHGTANFAPETDVWLGADFIDHYRTATILDELGKKGEGWSVDLCRELQLNLRCLPWEQIRDTVLKLATPDDEPRLREAFELLAAWDGHVTADSPAAAIYELFLADLIVRSAQAKAPNSWLDAVGGDGSELLGQSLFGDRRTGVVVKLILDQPVGWFAQGWPAILRDTLSKTITHLYNHHGPGPQWWHWGDLRPLHLTHILFGKHHWLGPIFNAKPVPIGGDGNTISQAGARPASPTDPTHNMANLRIVMDPSDWSNSRYVLAGGQSGNPFSPHFDDHFNLWQRGDAAPMAWTADEVLRATKTTLRLTPGAG